MSLEVNKTIARRHLVELWGRGDLDVVDEIYSPAAVGRVRNEPDQLGYPQCEKELVRADRITFPDGTVTVEDQTAEPDQVVTAGASVAPTLARSSATLDGAPRSRSPAPTSTASPTARSSRSGLSRTHSRSFALVADPDGYIIELLARDPIGQGATQPNLGDQASPVEH